VGGVLLPAGVLPPALAGAVSVLPSAALGDGLRTALVGGGWDWRALGLLLLWTVLAGLVARRLLRWSD
jgi:ABC-2 type transport system permease protein